MSQSIAQFTDENFDRDVVKSSQPVLVDFWAEWCAPCRALTPVVEDIAKETSGKLTVGKMNIDEHPNTPGKYAVQAIPTLLLFKNGEVVDKVVGLVNRSKLLEMVQKHI